MNKSTVQNFGNALQDAESYLSETLSTLEQERAQRVKNVTAKTRKNAQVLLENPEENAKVVERIDRLRACLMFVRNMRLNIKMFEKKKGLKLRINQLRGIQALIEFFQAEGHGDSVGYFKQPTGAGKTVLFSIIARLIDVQTLILVPRTNLLAQTKEEMTDVVGIPAEQIGLVGKGTSELGKKYTVATYQSHMAKMKRDPAYRAQMANCSLVICDEAHRSLGKATQESLEALDGECGEFDDEMTVEEQESEDEFFDDLEGFTPKKAFKIGFTATPALAGKHLQDTFKHLIAEEKMGELVKAGIVVPYRIVHVDGTVTPEDVEKYISAEDEIRILKKSGAYKKLLGEYSIALAAYNKHKTKEEYPLRGVAFCVNIDECDKFKIQAEALGIRSEIVTSREAKGKEADDVLEAAEKRLVDGEIDMIITVNKLGEGWNFPPASAAIWARATKSPMLLIQGVGRVGRAYEDESGTKEFAYVFETNWQLKGGKRKTKNNAPLRIADALVLNGENVGDVCSMADDSKVEHLDILTVEKVTAEIREGFTPETWAQLTGPEKKKLTFLGRPYGRAIATLFGLSDDPSNNHLFHLAIGRKVWGEEHLVLQEQNDDEIRKSIVQEIQFRFTPETWAKLKCKERNALTFLGRPYSRAIATLFGFTGDPRNKHSVHLAIGRQVWGEKHLVLQEVTTEAVTIEIKKNFTPEAWAKLKQTEKKDLRFFGQQYGQAIAYLFGFTGNPVNTHSIHLSIGRKVWGEQHSELKKEVQPHLAVEAINTEIKKNFTPETWAKLKPAEKKDLKFFGRPYGMAIATIYGFKGDPISYKTIHLAIGRKVWGDLPILQEQNDEQLLIQVTQEMVTRFKPEAWSAMKKHDKKSLSLCGRTYGIAIAKLFGVEGNPANKHSDHLAIGRKVWGVGHPALQEQSDDEIRKSVTSEIRTRFSPETWAQLRNREKKSITFLGGPYGNATATLYGFKGDPIGYKAIHLAIGRKIWGEDHPALQEQ